MSANTTAQLERAIMSYQKKCKDLSDRLAEAQARAERAEGEKLGLIVDCERLSTDLEQALRQWKMYADERENEDLDKEDHIEALSYRSCVQTAKDWRDKAFSLTHPALTPAPQGRTDGELLDWLEDDKEWFVGVENDYHERDETDNEALWRVSKWVSDDLCVNGTANTLRAAINLAMDATAPEVKGGAA